MKRKSGEKRAHHMEMYVVVNVVCTTINSIYFLLLCDYLVYTEIRYNRRRRVSERMLIGDMYCCTRVEMPCIMMGRASTRFFAIIILYQKTMRYVEEERPSYYEKYRGSLSPSW